MASQMLGGRLLSSKLLPSSHASPPSFQGGHRGASAAMCQCCSLPSTSTARTAASKRCVSQPSQPSTSMQHAGRAPVQPRRGSLAVLQAKQGRASSSPAGGAGPEGEDDMFEPAADDLSLESEDGDDEVRSGSSIINHQCSGMQHQCGCGLCCAWKPKLSNRHAETHCDRWTLLCLQCYC